MENGGKRQGAGRKPRSERLSNYDKALKLLDDSIEKALQVLIDGLDDENKQYRIRCAELLLKKALPDKIELGGKDGEPLQLEISNKFLPDLNEPE